MKILVNNVDIINDVEIDEAVYETCANGMSNKLFLNFLDVNNQWQAWKFKQNDEIRLIDGHCDTKAMFVKSTKLTNGRCSVIATSTPNTVQSIQNLELENTNLFAIAQLVANDIGFMGNIDITNKHSCSF